MRVYTLSGFYVVTYGLGIYIANMFFAFLSPNVDPALELEMVCVIFFECSSKTEPVR